MSRPEFDLSVYLVTDTAQCGGVDAVIRTVREAARTGVTLVQLRDHELSDDDFVTLGRRLVEVLRESGIPLLVDDRVELVDAIGAQGAHVGQGDLAVGQARRILGPDALLGLSAQSPEHVAVAQILGDDVVDYLGVGALHATATKPEAGNLGLDRIARVVDVSPWPVCAIGGVKASDAADLAAVGCSGMSVVSAICGQPDVGAATRQLREAWAAATSGTQLIASSS
ncbi:thiamine-phosphate pyrophosphorylase [Propionibacterium cyclohexanicum]|uniref:Thiamine-phosphate synthase n=1 Tax=Propionibacterium cyclohexanicum TaxID=64702 RepID=A0A1H9RTT0_9ACTN|nr:thiamine phosphate synthase [Propionibacterium cyclohexanicum]SER76270.1 thiamine-phosphate pyrophosphorylase [Propionibacterium cyclohexanicum]